MKLLIVDDESRIREGLCSSIDWAGIGIDEVDVAANGIEAYTLFKDRQHEIVITDIRMPGIDGLELSDKLIQLNNKVHIVILSGYSEFEYAKRAMKLGVTDYELKPVNLDALRTLVFNAVQKRHFLDKKEAFKECTEQAYWTTKVQNALICKTELDLSLLDNISRFFGIPLQENVICIQAEPDSLLDVQKEIDWSDTIAQSLANVQYPSVFFMCDGKKNKKIIVVPSELNISRAQIGTFHESLCAFMQKRYGFSVSFGVSECGKFIQLHTLCQQAENALQHKFYLNARSVVFFEDIKGLSCVLGHKLHYHDTLRDPITRHDRAAAEEIIRQLFNSFIAARCVHAEEVRAVCNDLKQIILNLEQDIYVPSYIEYEQPNPVWTELPEFDTISGYLNWSICALDNFFELQDKYNQSPNTPLMRRCAEYIQNRFREPLSLSDLALYVHRSPNYLSHLFKVQFNISFCEYVNNIRIREAKRLLKQTDLLMYVNDTLILDHSDTEKVYH